MALQIDQARHEQVIGQFQSRADLMLGSDLSVGAKGDNMSIFDAQCPFGLDTRCWFCAVMGAVKLQHAVSFDEQIDRCHGASITGHFKGKKASFESVINRTSRMPMC